MIWRKGNLERPGGKPEKKKPFQLLCFFKIPVKCKRDKRESVNY